MVTHTFIFARLERYCGILQIRANTAVVDVFKNKEGGY